MDKYHNALRLEDS